MLAAGTHRNLHPMVVDIGASVVQRLEPQPALEPAELLVALAIAPVEEQRQAAVLAQRPVLRQAVELIQWAVDFQCSDSMLRAVLDSQPLVPHSLLHQLRIALVRSVYVHLERRPQLQLLHKEHVDLLLRWPMGQHLLVEASQSVVLKLVPIV